jgi:hypothetical protein
MNFLRSIRIYVAFLFQVAIIFLILSTASEAAPQAKSQSKTLLCVSPGASMVVRETSEQIASTLSFLKFLGLQEIWRNAVSVHTSQLFTNAALQISTRIFNPFYILTTIHAP